MFKSMKYWQLRIPVRFGEKGMVYLQDVERGPTESGRVEVDVMTGREGFWIGETPSGSLEILSANMLRVSSGRDSSNREMVMSSSVRYQVCSPQHGQQ